MTQTPYRKFSKQVLFLDAFTQPHYTRYLRKQRIASDNPKGSVPHSANRQQSLTDIVAVRSVCKQVQQLEIGSIRPFSKLRGQKKCHIKWATQS